MARAFKDIYARLRGRGEPEPEVEMPAHRLAALRHRALEGELPEPGADEAEEEIEPQLALNDESDVDSDFDDLPILDERKNDRGDEAVAVTSSPGPQPIVLVRQARERGIDWRDGTSWFGGLPKLGDTPWPRNADGVPLPFAAQIDLTEIAALNTGAPLPPSGSLAFFLDSGAVIFAPEGASETPAPGDLPPAYDANGYPFQEPSLLSRPLFPFWPIEFLPIDLPAELRDHRDEESHEAIGEALHAAVSARVGRREFALGATSLRKLAGIEALPVWWHGVDHLVAALRQPLASAPRVSAMRDEAIARARDDLAAQEAAAEAEDPDALGPEALDEARNDLALMEEGKRNYERQCARLLALITALEGFAAARGPWEALNAEEEEVLVDALSAARRDHGSLVLFDVKDLSVLSLRAMMTGDAAAVAAIPEPVLAAINANYRLPSQSLQQMFGLGSNIQTAVYDHQDDVLLLQLTYDDMMEWRFGDMGAFQFWISPDDLAAQRWDRVTLTFECG